MPSNTFQSHVRSGDECPGVKTSENFRMDNAGSIRPASDISIPAPLKNFEDASGNIQAVTNQYLALVAKCICGGARSAAVKAARFFVTIQWA